MTATTAPTQPRATQANTAPSIFADVVRSEWTKIRSVRSTYWTLFAAAVATIGLGALLCSIYVSRFPTLSPADKARFDATSFSLSGVMLAQLAVGVLGVLLMSSEYSTGMIRATFAAVPQRRLVLAAKATVFTAVMVAVGVASSFIAFFVGQSILSGRHLQASISGPGVARSVVGAGLYLAVLGLLSLGLGTLIRHTAGGIAAIFGLILVLPGIVQALPTSWINAINKYLPSQAGSALFHPARQAHMLAPWAGFGVFCAYAAAALVAAGWLLTHRDA